MFYQFLSKLPGRDRLLYILLRGYQNDTKDYPQDAEAISQIYETEIKNILGEDIVPNIPTKKMEALFTLDKQLDEKFGKWDDSDEDIPDATEVKDVKE